MIISIAIVLFIDDKSFLCDQCYTKAILSVAVSGFFYHRLSWGKMLTPRKITRFVICIGLSYHAIVTSMYEQRISRYLGYYS